MTDLHFVSENIFDLCSPSEFAAMASQSPDSRVIIRENRAGSFVILLCAGGGVVGLSHSGDTIVPQVFTDFVECIKAAIAASGSHHIEFEDVDLSS